LALIEDAEGLPRWCPAVFLALEVITPGGPEGKVVRLRTRGWLPYVVRFDARVARLRLDPPAIAVEVCGDFEGVGDFLLHEREGGLDVTLDWRVRFRKPVVSALMGLLGPLLFTNHVWTLRRAHRGLVREIGRRRALAVPPPTPAPAAGSASS
jgi:hypothetical protein